MRTALILVGALAALALTAPAGAATKPSMVTDPYFDVQQMRLAFSHIHSVQAIEKFGNGVVATVSYAPSDGPRIAMASNDGNQALLDFVAQPGGDLHVDSHQLFTITGLGMKTVNAEKLWGYQLVSRTGGGIEQVWVNANYLPVRAHIEVKGQMVDVAYGNYDVPVYFATRQ